MGLICHPWSRGCTFKGRGLRRGHQVPPSPVHGTAVFSRLSFHHLLQLRHLNELHFVVWGLFFLPLNKYFSKHGIQRRGHFFCMGICLLSFYGHFYIQKAPGLAHHSQSSRAPLSALPCVPSRSHHIRPHSEATPCLSPSIPGFSAEVEWDSP